MTQSTKKPSPKGGLTRRNVLKGGAAVAGLAAGSGVIKGFPTVWAQNIKDVTLNHTGHVLFDADRHRPAGERGPRLQGRDVGRRPSGPDQPHGQRSELDRRRRHAKSGRRRSSCRSA